MTGQSQIPGISASRGNGDIKGAWSSGNRIYLYGSNFLEEALVRNELGMLKAIDLGRGNTLHEEIRRDWLGNLLAAKYPRPEMVGSKSQPEQACWDTFELDCFARLIGAKLGTKASDWGNDYGQVPQRGDRKLAFALDKVLGRHRVDSPILVTGRPRTLASRKCGAIVVIPT